MLWIHMVSKEVSDSVDDTEKKRQEAINELIYTERDFVRDMEYLRDVSLSLCRCRCPHFRKREKSPGQANHADPLCFLSSLTTCVNRNG